MRRMAKILAAAVMAVAFAGTALAQDHESAGNGRSSSDANVTNYTFTDGSDVHGGPVGPDGSQIRSVLPKRKDTLIHPRMHYVDRLLASVENL